MIIIAKTLENHKFNTFFFDYGLCNSLSVLIMRDKVFFLLFNHCKLSILIISNMCCLSKAYTKDFKVIQ